MSSMWKQIAKTYTGSDIYMVEDKGMYGKKRGKEEDTEINRSIILR